MAHLTLAGVSDDGKRLRLVDDEGVEHTVEIDERLRAALRGNVGSRRLETKMDSALRPRDIQARIRAGATAEQVAAESGVELASVRRYEGPVRAERDYVAYLAQRVEVATPIPSHDGYRSAFGEDPALLGDMVAFRVQSYGIDPASLEWDSWRRPDGSWHVEASFDLPDDSTVDLGEQPPAQWTYNPTRKTVVNGNRWAQVLSELEPLDGPLPARRLSAVADRVFDFEAEKQEETPEAADQDGLLDVLRSRRGQRLGTDEEGDDALAELLTRGAIPAAHPRNDAEDSGNLEDEADHDAVAPGLSLAPRVDEDTTPERQEDGSPQLYDGVSTETREISVFAEPTRRPEATAGQKTEQDDTTRPESRRKGPSGKDTGRNRRTGGGRDAADTGKATEGSDDADTAAGPERRVKPKRSSVPSWDDIVFGRKGD